MHKNRNINQKLADLYSFACLYKKLILLYIYKIVKCFFFLAKIPQVSCYFGFPIL